MGKFLLNATCKDPRAKPLNVINSWNASVALIYMHSKSNEWFVDEGNTDI